MMRNPLDSIVIVGAGLAGAEAAKTLRGEGFDGRITLIGDEPRAPYERPPLSKDYLRGETGVGKLAALEPDWYERGGVELLAGRRATDLRIGERNVLLDDGRTVPFDGLLIATGATPARPAIDGAELPFAHVLRTIEDADRLRDAARSAGHAIVAGGGWIAAEVAASLRQFGIAVTLVVPADEVVARSLGGVVGARYSELHRRHGVRVVTNTRVGAVVDDPAGRGVRLATGERIFGDLVVLGFGAMPSVALATHAGLAVDGGIVADEQLRTSAPGVFTAGDVARAWHPRYGAVIRSEHWDNARHQGRTAARNLLGRREVYDRVPYFYSDQYDAGMEFVGRFEDGDETIVRSAGDDAFVALWLRDRRVVAGLHVNTWDAKKPLEEIVTSGVAVDPRVLADPTVPLVELLELVAEPTAA
ncbi:MAG TPA: FAD-dependent oxidoreductase [Candidatus Limnocylindrales bacterium]|nr:FAD-dependent oxidoreductase [Candidatus Limnocylindrales bacterium]